MSSIHELASAGAADQMREGEHHTTLSAALKSKALEVACDVSAGATAGGERSNPPTKLRTKYFSVIHSYLASEFSEKTLFHRVIVHNDTDPPKLL